MRVLVAYASRHGATRGIAERIAGGLRDTGHDAEARPVGEVAEPSGYDAFVVGSAAYMFHWLKEATRFVERNGELLASRPLWLFSSGPIGTDLVDRNGRDVVEASIPKEFPDLVARLRPRATRIFFGAWDPSAPPAGMAERLVRLAPASKSMLPAGDFRDWPAIDAWAAEIAGELASVGVR